MSPFIDSGFKLTFLLFFHQFNLHAVLHDAMTGWLGCLMLAPMILCYVSRGRCGHCKKLAPEYEKLGESFKKAKSVLIGKVSLEILKLFGFIIWGSL